MATDPAALEFSRFHETELPARLAAGNGRLARGLAAQLGPLGVQLPDGRAFTYRASEEGIDVEAGATDARTVVEFDHACWVNLARDLESGPGLLYSKRGDVVRGDGMTFLAWESAWRAMFHGRPIYDPADQASQNLVDREGAPLDASQTFTPQTDLDTMSHFMQQTGFMLIRGLFSDAEVACFWAASDELKERAREGDGESWWAKTRSGQAVLSRVLDGSVHEAFRGLEGDLRLTRPVAAVEPGLVPNLDAGDFASILYKNPDVVEGLSDLPWHRDCGMGGHATMCPTINVSIFLSEANDATGSLKVLPGSHRGSVPFMDARHAKAPAGLYVAAGPGDVSFHYGDVMHAAPPPVGEGPFRRSVVLTWKPRDAQPHTGERHYNDILLEGSEDGQVADLERVLGEG